MPKGIYKHHKKTNEHKKHISETCKRVGVGKWMRGRHLSEKTKNKIGEACKGKKHTEETKRKISMKHMGKKFSLESRIKMSKVKKGMGRGKKCTDATRKKISKRLKGKKRLAIRGRNHWAWKGGTYRLKRHDDMGRVEYKNWRRGVFERDNYTCRLCGERGIYLNAHHINNWSKFPEYRYNLSNGITLCVKHHRFFHQLTQEKK